MYDFAEMQEGLCRAYLTLSPEMCIRDRIGVPQEPRYHREGDVWTHTMLVLDLSLIHI